MIDRRETANRALSLLDLTDLSDDCTEDRVVDLCRRAVSSHGHVAAVCVWPRFVRRAKSTLDGTRVRVATVVNFPTGDEDVIDVVSMTRRAIEDGADEIDVVLPYRAVLAGDEARAVEMLENVRRVASHPVVLKVILETGELPDDSMIIRCARLAVAAGADFIKTSTGKTPTSATVGAVETVLTVIAETTRPIGIKPSGGVKSLDDAARYLAVADRIMGPEWVSPATFRFGASGLLDGILDELS